MSDSAKVELSQLHFLFSTVSRRYLDVNAGYYVLSLR